MLTLKSLVSFAAMAVFSASAAPAPVAEIQARDDYAMVKICKDHFFQGECLIVGIHDGQCLANLGNNWNDAISSYEVINRAQWVCGFYEHASCQGAKYDAQIDDTLHDGNGAWADRITSISCATRKTVCQPFC